MSQHNEPSEPAPHSANGDEDDAIPGLFSSSPYAILALLAAGTGCMAIGVIGVEILTDRSMAKTIDVGIKYVSLPMGIATLVLAGLTAVDKPRWSAPSVFLGLVYFLLFWLT